MEFNIKAELAKRNIPYKDMAGVINVTPNALYRKLRNNYFTIDEVALIAAKIGMKLELVPA